MSPDRLVSVIERLLAATGGRKAALAGTATETITTTGWRRHPGWGSDPSQPETVADFSFALLQSTVRPPLSPGAEGADLPCADRVELFRGRNGSTG